MDDLHLAVKGGVIDPVIEAAPLERVMHFAGAVGGEDDDGRFGCADRAEFRDRDLEIGERFEQEGLERFIGAVQFVDQQDRGAAGPRAHRLQERAFDQVVFGEQFRRQRVTVGPAPGLGGADRDHLGGEVPFADRRGGIEPLIALQPDQAAPKARGDGLGDFGLADARLAFEEQGPTELEGEKDHRGQRPSADIVLSGQQPLDLINRLRYRGHVRLLSAWCHAGGP